MVPKLFSALLLVSIFVAIQSRTVFHKDNNLKSNGPENSYLSLPITEENGGNLDENHRDEDAEPGESIFFFKKQEKVLTLPLSRRFKPWKSVIESTTRDLNRIQSLQKRVIEGRNQNPISRLKKDRNLLEHQSKSSPKSRASPATSNQISGQLMATIESGLSLGSGEYFIDVFVGVPPKHFSLILDTGSDLKWIQSSPCYDCFEQEGPYYNPKESTSFNNISCHDPKCHLVSSPEPSLPCKNENQTCPYYYWYGDSSNTKGDFALETFTLNLTMPNGEREHRQVENVMFGCGHWNRGLFHGASGLLGLGRGPLSFASQLQSLYGHSFSYCFVDWKSERNVSSKLVFGEGKDLVNNHGDQMNFTSFLVGGRNRVDSFYYLQVKAVLVGGEELRVPEETWDGGGGTIIDSGTSISYFVDPAYRIIKKAFIRKVRGYPKMKEENAYLEPCYNVSGAEKPELPEFGIRFADGAVWNFPVENSFIRLGPDIVCLAIKGTPPSALSIIGNYQQQNFHVLYDTKMSRLGFALTKCADS